MEEEVRASERDFKRREERDRNKTPSTFLKHHLEMGGGTLLSLLNRHDAAEVQSMFLDLPAAQRTREQLVRAYERAGALVAQRELESLDHWMDLNQQRDMTDEVLKRRIA